jgi:hypothetical protein
MPRPSLTTQVLEVLEDGTRILKDGSRVNPDGSITLADGTVIPRDVAAKLAQKRKATLPARRPGESEEDYQARIRQFMSGGSAGGADGSGADGYCIMRVCYIFYISDDKDDDG